jgi:hypothetical protein
MIGWQTFASLSVKYNTYKVSYKQTEIFWLTKSTNCSKGKQIVHYMIKQKWMPIRPNRIGGVMVSVLASGAVDSGL